MREDTVTTEVYEFDELSDEAKAVAVQGLADINVGHECWDNDAEESAKLILEHHGETCETHKDATAFLADLKTLRAKHEAADDYDPEYDYVESDVDGFNDACEEFRQTICEDYRIMLQKEYEHQSSEEQIIETIRANEYEFTADGDIYIRSLK